MFKDAASGERGAVAGKKNSRDSAKRERRERPRPLWLRVLRWAALAVVALAAIPLLLTPLYRIAAPVSTLMVWDRITGEPVTRDWVPLEDISENLVKAVISSEDNFFCRHSGVDWGAVREVLQSGSDRGASTIAMQTARNLFLWQGRSYVRKALEVPIALYAYVVLGKKRVLEIYLNIAEWGPGIFGIEAAAQHHFGVAAADLTLRQATLMAVTLPDPIGRDPASPSPSMQRIADIISGRVADGVDMSCLEG